MSYSSAKQMPAPVLDFFQTSFHGQAQTSLLLNHKHKRKRKRVVSLSIDWLGRSHPCRVPQWSSGSYTIEWHECPNGVSQWVGLKLWQIFGFTGSVRPVLHVCLQESPCHLATKLCSWRRFYRSSLSVLDLHFHERAKTFLFFSVLNFIRPNYVHGPKRPAGHRLRRWRRIRMWTLELPWA